MSDEDWGARVVTGYELGRYDHVSLLPNRQSLLAETAEAAPADRVIVMITLTEAHLFQQIQRALGHATSEGFVRICASRISEVLGHHVPLYHISQLSFACRADPNRAEAVAAALLRPFRTPVVCDGIPIDTRIGIGLHRVPFTRGVMAEDLRAALAAAQDGRARPERWAWYNKQSDDAHRRAFRLLTDLNAALEASDQLSLQFQPKVELGTGIPRSVEALLRWDHPVLGSVAPGEFIPLVEATALITPLTRWVIAAAVEELAGWRSRGREIGMAINISPKNLEEPDFVEYLTFCCAARGVPPSALELEITEGVSVASGPLVLARLAALRRQGFSIAIDDFGSGFSNMASLTRLCARTLKLDRSLLQGLHESETPGRLLTGIVKLARDLGYNLVAEGVETEADLRLLTELGIDLGQGWLFAQALSAPALQDWLDARGCVVSQRAAPRRQ